MWFVFMDVLQTAVRLFVPVCKQTGTKENDGRKCYPSAVRKIAHRKLKLWRQCKKFPLDTDKQNRYRTCEISYKKAIHKHEADVEQNIVDANNLGGS